MNRKIIITASVFTSIGIINAVVFIILSCLNVISAQIFSYLLLALYILAVWLPVILAFVFKIKFNFVLVIAYEFFIILAILVGSLWKVYELNSYFDKIVHLLSGILFAMSAYNLFTCEKRNKADLSWMFLICFSFSMMFGGVWEICEFTFDSLLSENSQKWMGFVGHRVLMDTMLDLICDFFGGLIGGISAILIELNKRKRIAQTAESN